MSPEEAKEFLMRIGIRDIPDVPEVVSDDVVHRCVGEAGIELHPAQFSGVLEGEVTITDLYWFAQCVAHSATKEK